MAEHQVFVFRHCVRSTTVQVELGQPLNLTRDNSTVENDATTAIDMDTFFQLPDWNTPKMWCTERGIQQTEAVGKYLLEQLWKKNHKKRIHVEFIADSGSQRDIDTAWALARGMKTDLKVDYGTSDIVVTGLDTMHMLPELFHPVGDICPELEYTTDERINQIQKRLDLLAPVFPTHPSNVVQQLSEVFSRLGVKKQNDLTWESIIPMDIKVMPYPSRPNRTIVSGPIEFVKLASQIIFYSTASQIGPYNNTALWQDLNTLLPWIYLARAMLNYKVPSISTRGALMTALMEHVLRKGCWYEPCAEGPYDLRVTVIAGHDGDLDSVASALDVSWSPNEGIFTGMKGEMDKDMIATPPLSHVSVSRPAGTENLEVLFRHPLYAVKQPNGSWVDVVAEGSMATVAVQNAPKTLDEWRQRARRSSEVCYDQITTLFKQSNTANRRSNSSSGGDDDWGVGMAPFGVAVGIGMLIACIAPRFFRSLRNRNNQSAASPSISMYHDNNAVEMT